MDIAQCNLDGNADAVEFCPFYPHHNVLAAATYTLQEGDEPTRCGSISLFSVSCDKGLELLQKVATVGVFDIKWKANQAGTQCQLAQADAGGHLRLYCLESKLEKECMLREVATKKISSSMCLYVDWNPFATSISLGLSDGSVSLVTLSESELHHSQSWDAHNHEVWSTSFDLHQPKLLYTGSDDCRLCCWDIREGFSTSVFQNAKSHKMGVCCIAKNPTDPNVLVTGSYDENLRSWDLRSMSMPVNQSSLGLGGGVWRIKFHPVNSDLLLAACMHNGFAIVRKIEEGFIVAEKYMKHGSLAYGAEWHKGRAHSKHGTIGGPMVATCSFYDRLLCIWLPKTLLVEQDGK